MNQLQFLKNEGHKLLEEYIALDPNKHGGPKKERDHAYSKLESKLRKRQKAHFSMMHTEAEVLQAISKLGEMIKKRAERIKREGWDKSVIAPNVQELQRQASELNKELIK